MQQSELKKALIDIAGPLRPGRGVSDAMLESARAAVARALYAGQPIESMLSPGFVALPEANAAVNAKLDDAKVSSAVAAAGQPAGQVYLRTTPIRTTADPGVPSWARGMAASNTLGPFVDAVGRPVWLDVFQPATLVGLVRDPGAHPIGAFPVARLQPAANHRKITLGRGSVWVVATLLAPGSPANGFVGFRITHGELDFSADVGVVNGVIHVPANAEVRLTATLEQPDAPVPSAGPGVDAVNAIVDLPANVSIAFTAAGAAFLHVEKSTAKVFGCSIDLNRSNVAPRYDSAFQEIIVPCSPAPANFTIVDRRSTFFLLDGAGLIKSAGWALPVTTTALNQLSEAAGAGALVLEVEKGLSADWQPLGRRASLVTTTLHLSPGQIGIHASTTGTPFNTTFQLWDEDRPEWRSSLEFFYSARFDILYLSQPGVETLAVTGGAAAHLDRPVAADGGRFAWQAPQAQLLLLSQTSGQQVFVGGMSQVAVFEPMTAIALENALLKVHAPQNLFMAGTLRADGSVVTGDLFIGFALRSILPTLPDPYAATFASRNTGDADIGTLVAHVSWTSPETPRLTFDLSIPNGNPLAGLGISERRLTTIGLLDVSSHVDQLGVFFTEPRELSLSVDQIAMATAGQGVGIFTVPEISWEPMQSDEPAIGVDTPPNDGGPSSLMVSTVRLSRIAPKPVLDLFIDRVAKNNEPFTANVTLPFGLHARIRDAEYTSRQGVFQLIQPAFGSDFRGGLQLEMKPPRADIDPTAMFSGWMETVPPKVPPNGATPPSGYGAEVLSPDVANIVDDEFAPGGFRQGVPIHRYDLSGYGASVFSDWRNPDAPGTEVIEVRFDVLVGRTAYEVVQVQSFKYPFGARMVRTITIDRREAGWVHRHDSGWVAATPGVYRYPNPGEFPANRVHPGAVLGAFNIRRVREQGDIIPIGPPGAQIFFEKVLYDADIKIDPAAVVVAGGFAVGGDQFVACRDLVGYIQIGRAPASPNPATRAELAVLLDKTGPVGGPISCVVALGAAKAKFKAATVDVAISDTTADACVVGALRGVPALPRQGSWSVAKRASGQTAPRPLDPGTATPLIKGSDDPKHVWHYGDPVDVRTFGGGGAPQVEYGFLQSTGTQKLFFARPEIDPASTDIHIPDPPHLADAAALLSAASAAFPDLSSALKFDAAQSLPVSGDAINYDHSFTVTAPDRPLVDFKAVKTVLAYHDKTGNATVAHVHIDAAGWQIELRRVSFQTVVTAFGSAPLITIVGVMKASSTSAPTLTEMEVIYGGFLDPVQTVFSNLQKLATFLPGGAGAGLKVSFSNGKLSVTDSYALPTLPLGFGEISDVSLNLGVTAGLTPLSLEFIAGIGSEYKPFHWLVSPLSGTGMVEVGARNGDMVVAIQAGIGAGLEINLGIAKGAASIVLAFQVDNKIAPFEIKVMLTGNAAVDVLAGLASAALTLTAMLGIAPDGNFPPKKITVLGGVAVGIHISICWVIDIDFDGHWQFSQEFSSPLNVIA